MATIRKAYRTRELDLKIDLDYFHKHYHRKYLPELIGRRGKNERKIDKDLYKRIFMEYWDVYFKEIYFKNENSYFLYTGVMEKISFAECCLKKTDTEGNVWYEHRPDALGFAWYERPSLLFHWGVKILKLSGSSNRMPKIEKLFKSTTDINFIINFEKLLSNKRKLRKLYLK